MNNIYNLQREKIEGFLLRVRAIINDDPIQIKDDIILIEELEKGDGYQLFFKGQLWKGRVKITIDAKLEVFHFTFDMPDYMHFNHLNVLTFEKTYKILKAATKELKNATVFSVLHRDKYGFNMDSKTAENVRIHLIDTFTPSLYRFDFTNGFSYFYKNS